MKYEKAWLNGQVGVKPTDCKLFGRVITEVTKEISEHDEKVLLTAKRELIGQAEEMFGRKPAESDVREDNSENAIDVVLRLTAGDEKEGSYRVKFDEAGFMLVESASAEGILYGVFNLFFKLRNGLKIGEISLDEEPASPLRMLNHWDNMDGSIERGYSGQSFFFKDNEVIVDDRIREYARLTASVGINASVINNVNVRGAATKLIAKEYREKIKQYASIFEEYGIKLFFSLNFAAPMELGGPQSADPCDEEVKAWWKENLTELFEDVPNLGGFLIKADSEGRPGPFTYNRTHAEGANMLAEIIEPYGGIIIWRCFVYNCRQDWRDTKTDRARAGYDNFKPLDGQFKENVILQVKNGPMDFQIREPVSPLLGGMEKTNEIVEFQIAQEYTGQQRHVCYLIPEFKEVLGFETYIREKGTVEDIVTGRTFGNKLCGMAAVANTGDDSNWTGHDFAAANYFGFGKLAYNPKLTAEEIASEWIGLTFGNDETVKEIILKILMPSREIYEKYTSPLGIGWMVNPNYHYGPNVDGYEYSQWGTYHRADRWGMGVERGSTGTGYVKQYNEPNSSMYDLITKCPEELLLFFHYIPYDYVLSTGKTLIQHIYDSHFEGVEDVEKMVEMWKSLEGAVAEPAYGRVRERLDHQLESAKEWRDQINSYFYRKSGIADKKGRKIY